VAKQLILRFHFVSPRVLFLSGITFLRAAAFLRGFVASWPAQADEAEDEFEISDELAEKGEDERSRVDKSHKMLF